MRLTTFAIQKTGLSAAVLFDPFKPLVRVFSIQGVETIFSWTVPNVVAPTSSEIAAALAAPEPEPALADVQAIQLAALGAACAAAILAGFTSSALGKPYLYGSKTTDQANYDTAMMMASQATGTGTGANASGAFKCLDAAVGNTPATVWPLMAHDQAQIGRVWADCQAMITTARTKLSGFESQVAAAASVAAVQALVWA